MFQKMKKMDIPFKDPRVIPKQGRMCNLGKVELQTFMEMTKTVKFYIYQVSRFNRMQSTLKGVICKH